MRRWRRVVRWWRSPRLLCGWCKRIILIGGPLSFLPGAVRSHSICGKCALREKRRRTREALEILRESVWGPLPEHPAPRFSVRLDGRD